MFLATFGTAFSGYVLVAGNMSFWAAIVILNLATVLPVVASELVSGLLAGPVMTDLGLRRFTALHFALAVGSLGLSVLHLLLVHRSFPSASGHMLQDGSGNLEGVLRKDGAVVFLAASCFCTTAAFELVHPDNWGPFSSTSTPEHIEPEVYFLWSFAMIKLHNSKLAGVVA